MIPDRFYIEKEDRKLYEIIEGEDMFEGRARKEQFLFAMAVGFLNKTSLPLKTKDGFFLSKDLRPEDEALLNTIAMSKKNKSVNCLMNREEVFKIAEEFAHAGINLLADKIQSTEYGTFWKRLELELFEIYEKNISTIDSNDE